MHIYRHTFIHTYIHKFQKVEKFENEMFGSKILLLIDNFKNGLFWLECPFWPKNLKRNIQKENALFG